MMCHRSGYAQSFASRRGELVARHICVWVCLLGVVAIAGCASREMIGAVQTNDLPAVKRLVKRDHRLANTMVTGGVPSSLSILQYAIYRNERDVAKYLINAGADVNVRDSLDRTALHYAVEKRDVELAELLIRHKADTAAVDRLGRSALLEAVRQGDSKLACLLRQHAARDVPLIDETAALNKAEHVRRILKQNARAVDAADAEGWTPLHYAADRGHLDIVRILIRSQARVEAKDKRGWTALHLAARGGHLAVVRILLDQRAYEPGRSSDIDEALGFAVRSGNAAVVDLMLAHGANPNLKDGLGRTPIFSAAGMDVEDDAGERIARLLIRAGAKVNVDDGEDAWTPLHSAAVWNKPRTVHVLLENGAKIDAVNKEGKTALQLAEEGGGPAVARVIRKFAAQRRGRTKK